MTHGIFICLSCSKYHELVGKDFSIIRPISSDFWSPVQIETLRFGGNEKFKKFLKEYEIDDFAIQEKYRTLASKYYRLKLEALSRHLTPDIEPPSNEDGRKIPLDEE